jgi:hypothetical protein
MAVRLSALRVGRIFLVFICQRLIRPQGLNAAERIRWIEKIQWPHRECNPRPSGMSHSVSANYGTACPMRTHDDAFKMTDLTKIFKHEKCPGFNYNTLNIYKVWCIFDKIMRWQLRIILLLHKAEPPPPRFCYPRDISHLFSCQPVPSHQASVAGTRVCFDWSKLRRIHIEKSVSARGRTRRGALTFGVSLEQTCSSLHHLKQFWMSLGTSWRTVVVEPLNHFRVVRKLLSAECKWLLGCSQNSAVTSSFHFPFSYGTKVLTSFHSVCYWISKWSFSKGISNKNCKHISCCPHMGCGLSGPGSIPGRAKSFSCLQRPDRLWGPPGLLSNGRRGDFPGVEAAGAWSWPLTSI